MTNGDMIRAMTDEELAELFDQCADCQMCIDHPTQCHDECIDGYLKWLRKEAVEDADN